MATHTKAPWAWQKFGWDWCLTGQHGIRPIILTLITKNRDVPLHNAEMAMRDHERCMLVPLNPDAPDMRLIAESPAMYELLEQVLGRFNDPECTGLPTLTMIQDIRDCIQRINAKGE